MWLEIITGENSVPTTLDCFVMTSVYKCKCFPFLYMKAKLQGINSSPCSATKSQFHFINLNERLQNVSSQEEANQTLFKNINSDSQVKGPFTFLVLE